MEDELEGSVGARSWRASPAGLLLLRSEQVHPHAEEMLRVQQGAAWHPATGIHSVRRGLYRGGQWPSHV